MAITEYGAQYNETYDNSQICTDSFNAAKCISHLGLIMMTKQQFRSSRFALFMKGGFLLNSAAPQLLSARK